jgi:hypothetical protein
MFYLKLDDAEIPAEPNHVKFARPVSEKVAQIDDRNSRMLKMRDHVVSSKFFGLFLRSGGHFLRPAPTNSISCSEG